MQSLTLNNKYERLRRFIDPLPRTFHTTGTVLHDGRNVVKIQEAPGERLVVKYFRGMYFFNRLAYSTFRKSKAARSYLNSMTLNRHGIHTPDPVAWIDIYTSGLLKESYYVCVWVPFKTFGQVLEETQSGERRTRLLHRVAAFAIQLHQEGIFHRDFSKGNILIREEAPAYEFSLVDLNRMYFSKSIGFEEGLRTFKTLKIPDDDLHVIIAEYARLSGQPADAAWTWFLKFVRRKDRLRRMRKQIRYYTIGWFERMARGGKG